MAILTLNEAHRQAIADDTGARFNGGDLEIRTGAPLGADNAAGGSLLSTLSVSNPAFAPSGGGVVVSAETWQGAVTTTGAPGHYRLYSANNQEIREGDAAAAPGTGQVMLFTGLVGGDLISGGVVSMGAGNFSINQPSGA